MIRRISWMLLVTGIAALGYSAYVVVSAYAYQARAQRLFEEARVRAPATMVGDVLIPVSRPTYAEGDAIGHQTHRDFPAQVRPNLPPAS